VPWQAVTVFASEDFATVGTTYPLIWEDTATGEKVEGWGVATSRAALTLLTPELSRQECRVSFTTESRNAEFVVRVDSPPGISDPRGFVAAWQVEIRAVVAELLASAQSISDPARRAARIADAHTIGDYLDRLENEAGRAGESDFARVADFLAANPIVAGTEQSLGISVPELVAETSTLLNRGWTNVGKGGVIVVFAYYILPVSRVLAATAFVLGLSKIAQGGIEVSSALVTEFRPGGRVDIEFVHQFHSSDPTPDWNPGTAGSMQLTSGVSREIQVTAELFSLSTTDRASESAKIRSMCAVVDATVALAVAWPPEVRQLIAGPPPSLPDSSSSRLAIVSASELSLRAHSNSMVSLTLVNGSLTGSVSLRTSQVTTADFTYSVDDFAPVSKSIWIEVTSPALSATQLPLGALIPDHTIGFDDEVEPFGVRMQFTRLGGDGKADFHVNVVGPFYLFETGATNACFAGLEPHIGFADGTVTLTPSVPIRSFGGFFADSAAFGLGSSWQFVVEGAYGDALTLPLVEPACDCTPGPTHCATMDRWNGFEFSAPVTKIRLQLVVSGTFRFLPMDTLQWQVWR
jgi:hypothetical protein